MNLCFPQVSEASQPGASETSLAGTSQPANVQVSFSDSMERPKMTTSTSVAESTNGECEEKLSTTPSVSQLPKLINSLDDNNEGK